QACALRISSFFFQAEDGIRDGHVTGVQTCALPILQKVVTAGQAIVDGLVRNGVRHIFGIPGVHTYSLIDALAERQGELAYLGTRHEQGAAYMAYGYACSSGRVGAYTCVPGPGVLNTSEALCTSYAEIAPVLILY